MSTSLCSPFLHFLPYTLASREPGSLWTPWLQAGSHLQASASPLPQPSLPRLWASPSTVHLLLCPLPLSLLSDPRAHFSPGFAVYPTKP